MWLQKRSHKTTHLQVRLAILLARVAIKVINRINKINIKRRYEVAIR